MAWTQEKVEATLKSVVEKAQADAAFRERLKNNPKEVLAAEAGEMIPDAFRIAIIDQNDTDIVITLPKVQTDELSDADLEHVAGGKPDAQTKNMACKATSIALGTAAGVTAATGVGVAVGAGCGIAGGIAVLTSALI